MTQNGRSMVEMLAVLLIVAVLTVGTIVGIQILFVKYKATQIVKAISFAEQEIVQALQHNRPLETQRLNTRSFGWEEVYYEDCKDGSIDVVVTDLPESVCQGVIAILSGRNDLSFDVLARMEARPFTGFICRKDLDEYVSECQKGMINDVVITFYTHQLVPEVRDDTVFCETDEDCVEGRCCQGKCLSDEACEQLKELDCSGHGTKDEAGVCTCATGFSGDECQCEGKICGTECCSADQTCDGTGGFYRCIEKQTTDTCDANYFLYNGRCCPVQGQGNACSYFEMGFDGCPELKNRCNSGYACVVHKENDCAGTTDCCVDCSQIDAFSSTLEECDRCSNRFWANGKCYSCREEENIVHVSAQQCDRCLTRFFTGRNLLDGICYRYASEVCKEEDRLEDMKQDQCRACRRVWGRIGGKDQKDKCFNCSDNFFIWTTRADCNLCPKRFFTQEKGAELGRCYYSFQTACELSQFPSTEAQCLACGEGKRFFGLNGICYSCQIRDAIETTPEACENCFNRRYDDGKCKRN